FTSCCRAASAVTSRAAPRSAAVRGPRVLSSISRRSPVGAGGGRFSGWRVGMVGASHLPSGLLVNYSRRPGEKQGPPAEKPGAGGLVGGPAPCGQWACTPPPPRLYPPPSHGHVPVTADPPGTAPCTTPA